MYRLDDLSAAPVDLAEVRVGQGQRDLAHPIRAEVERDHRIAGAYAGLGVTHGHRRDELVRLVALVGVPRRLRGGCGVMVCATMDEQVVGALGAIPALVAVHRPVATDHRPDPARAGIVHPALDRLEIALARMGQRVAAVGESVQDEVFDPQ